MYENVDVHVVDVLTHDPVSRVYVRLLNHDGTIILQEGSTDDAGKISYVLPAHAVYQLRLFKFGARIHNPVFLRVNEGGPNSFEVQADQRQLPSSLDSDFCRASGYFRLIDGRPAKGVKLRLVPHFYPAVLNNAAVIKTEVIAETDVQGYVSVNLLRCAIYSCTVDGIESCEQFVHVPSSDRWDINDLLFPTVRRIDWLDPLPTEPIPVGISSSYRFHAALTDSRYLDPVTDLLLVESSSAGLIATLEVVPGQDVHEGKLTVLPTTPGIYTVKLKMTRKDYVHLPPRPIKGSVLVFSS